MLKPYARQKIKECLVGLAIWEKGRHLWPRFVQKIAEGKASNDLRRLESKSDDLTRKNKIKWHIRRACGLLGCGGGHHASCIMHHASHDKRRDECAGDLTIHPLKKKTKVVPRNGNPSREAQSWAGSVVMQSRRRRYLSWVLFVETDTPRYYSYCCTW